MLVIFKLIHEFNSFNQSFIFVEIVNLKIYMEIENLA